MGFFFKSHHPSKEHVQPSIMSCKFDVFGTKKDRLYSDVANDYYLTHMGTEYLCKRA